MNIKGENRSFNFEITSLLSETKLNMDMLHTITAMHYLFLKYSVINDIQHGHHLPGIIILSVLIESKNDAKRKLSRIRSDNQKYDK